MVTFLLRRTKAPSELQDASIAASAGEADGSAMIIFNPDASQELAEVAVQAPAGARDIKRRGNKQHRLFGNGFLSAKMSRARKLHMLMARLVGALPVEPIYLVADSLWPDT